MGPKNLGGIYMYPDEKKNLQAVCFTGHRDLTDLETMRIKKSLRGELEILIRQIGIRQFYTGGARGFDTLAALAVLEKRKIYPEIRLSVVIPHIGQEKYWREKEQTIYRRILRAADETIYLSEQYCKGCMQKRNRFLVDHADYCIAYLKKETGGTAFTVQYARARNKPVMNLALG